MNYRWALGALALCACSGEATETGDEGAVGTTSEAFNGATFTATTVVGGGSPSVNMGTATGRACFLARVEGKFYSTGDSATVKRVNGVWNLTVHSTAPNGMVLASAICVNGTVRNNENQLALTGQTLDLGLGGTCFLSHVAGHFGGIGDHVQVGYDGSRWNLQSKAQSPEGTEASAVCVSTLTPKILSNNSTFASWNAGDASNLILADANHTSACALFSMRGKFMGNQEYEIVEYNAGLQAHYLYGHVGGLGSAVGASAGCISAP